MNIQQTDFDLFQLPQQFALDEQALNNKRKVLLREVHPDKFAAQGAAAQRVAMQWAVRINEAYDRLRKPLSRAAYLCELAGVPIQANDNTAMPADFLMQQMQWREALDEGCDKLALMAEVQRNQATLLNELAQTIDQVANYTKAAAVVRCLMFIERFHDELDLSTGA